MLGIKKDIQELKEERKNNENKKAYMREYRNHVRRVNRIESEIEELRIMRISISGRNDGMPRGSGQSDLSGYAAELDYLETKLLEEKDSCILAYKDIANRINSLSNENEKDVLFYRYIKGLEWWEIAEKMGYSERQIHRYHGNALVHFQLSEEQNMS